MKADMGRMSAWMGVAIGVVIILRGLNSARLLFGHYVESPGLIWTSPLASVGIIAAGALLIVGAVRTLRKQSGGLRLLCGMWGAVAGLSLMPAVRLLGVLLALAFGEVTFNVENLDVLGFVLSEVLWGPAFVVSTAGLAMTVLHKEKKALP